MSYIKYSIFFVLISLVVAVVLGVLAGIMKINFGQYEMTFVFIAYFITSFIIIKLAIKYENRTIQTYEIIRLALSISLIWVILNCLFIVFSNHQILSIISILGIVDYIKVLAYIVIFFSTSVLLPLFIANKLFDKKCKQQ